jgi:hypothetical protein
MKIPWVMLLGGGGEIATVCVESLSLPLEGLHSDGLIGFMVEGSLLKAPLRSYGNLCC